MHWAWFAAIGALAAPLFVMPREVKAGFRDGLISGLGIWSGMSIVLGIPIFVVFWLVFG